MRAVEGKVAVVTGGGGGIGAALGRCFAEAGMRVVLADLLAGPLEDAVGALRDEGHEVVGVEVDVSDAASVDALRDRAYETFGGVHVLCNNAGVGAGAEGRMWEHTLNDWGWGLAVNVWGVIHGIRAFVPAMLAGGEEGHIVNTSSGNGGISPIPATAIYATTKAAVTTLTEVLYGQLRAVDAPIGVSVLYPGPKVLRTGLLGSSANRPAQWANAEARRTPHTTIESFEARLRAAGVEPDYTPVEAVAEETLRGILEDRFWILPASARTDEVIEARARSMIERRNPTYLRDL